MARGYLSIPDETARLVREYLARTGRKNSDLSAFVADACRDLVQRRTVAEIRARSADLTAEEAGLVPSVDARKRADRDTQTCTATKLSGCTPEWRINVSLGRQTVWCV